MKLFFHKTEAAINRKSRAEASTAIDDVLYMLNNNQHASHMKTYNYIKKNVRDMLLEIVSYVSNRSEYLQTPTHRTSNTSEAFNNSLKLM